MKFTLYDLYYYTGYMNQIKNNRYFRVLFVLLETRVFVLMVWKCYSLKNYRIKMFIRGEHVLRSYWQ